MKVYKLIALIGSIIVIVSSIIFNNQSNYKSIQFSVSYYPFWFIAFFYFLGGATALYILIKVLFVLRNKKSFYSYLESKGGKADLIKLFIRRHFLFILAFMLEFMPNNIVLLLQIFMSYKICENCNYYSVIIYLMSLSCTISFVIKFTEPYMQKYLLVVFNFLKGERIRDDIVNNSVSKDDYSNLYTRGGGLIDNNADYSAGLPVESSSSYMGPVIPTTELNDMSDPLNSFTKEMEASDFFVRMFGITLASKEDSVFDKDKFFIKNCKAFLPWDDELYNSKSELIEYRKAKMQEFIDEMKLKLKEENNNYEEGDEVDKIKENEKSIYDINSKCVSVSYLY